jgi:acyl-CoA hydrolase
VVSETIVLPQLTPNPEFSVAASRDRLERAQRALRKVNIETEIVSDVKAAHDRVLELVPEGSEVHIGLSETMRELGVTKLIEAGVKYNAIRPQLMKLDRITQRRQIAKLATAPDYMLGSVHAVTEEGELVVGSGSGSQLAPYASGAGHVILVAGAQKVVANLEAGLRRLREYSYPLEDARMKAAGRPGSLLAKTLIISYDSPGRTHLILVEEPVGF